MNRTFPWIAALAALATLCLHLAGNPHYGYFRDELYFIICGDHPQFGYVDQPPVVPLLAALTQLGPHSLFLLRAVPAICAAGGMYVMLLLVNEFGGSDFAQLLAAIAFTGAPVLMAFGMKVGPDEIGLWIWPLIVLWLVRIARGADPRWWIAIGAAVGIAGESKYTVLFFVVALAAGLAMTPQRAILRSRWALAGIVLAALIVLPNFLWQAANGFPMWELLEAGQHGKNVIVGPLLYFGQEIAIMNVYLAPLWIVGVVWLLRTPRVRFLGYAYLTLVVEMIVLHGKHYYPADIYPAIIAAGAVPVASWTSRLRFMPITVVAYAAFFCIVSLPLELPVLNEAQLLTFERTVVQPLYPIPQAALATERNKSPAIGSDYADMHGWPQLAAAVRRAFDALPPEQRSHAVVFATNYGDASALRFFAPDIPTVSTHNEYWLWGYGDRDISTILEIGGSCWKDEGYFSHSAVVAQYDTTLPVMEYENHIGLRACSGLRVPLRTLWNDSKMYL